MLGAFDLFEQPADVVVRTRWDAHSHRLDAKRGRFACRAPLGEAGSQLFVDDGLKRPSLPSVLRVIGAFTAVRMEPPLERAVGGSARRERTHQTQVR